MKIVVCIKQVPSTNEVKIDPVTKTIIRDVSHSVINPYDSYALELAVQIKEQIQGTEVIVLSMGIPATEKLLQDAVARGADEAMLLTDRAFAGADTLATSYTLAAGIKEIGNVSLVLCGKMAIDGDTAQIGPELAQWLGLVHITEVTGVLEIDVDHLVCTRLTDDAKETLEVQLPALLTVEKNINIPRMPSIEGVRHSLGVDVKRFDAKTLSLQPAKAGLAGSPTQVIRTWAIENNENAIQIDGCAGEVAKEIIALVEEVQG